MNVNNSSVPGTTLGEAVVVSQHQVDAAGLVQDLSQVCIDDVPGVQQNVGSDCHPVFPSHGRLDGNYLNITTRASSSVNEPSQLTVEIARCRCGSRFCPSCGVMEMRKLREKLYAVLHSFKHITMLTLTVDPMLFESPRQAYEYLRDNKCLSYLMRDVRKMHPAVDIRYFAVLEFQEREEMPHYHVLTDSPYIEKDKVAELWGKHRPKTWSFHNFLATARFICFFALSHMVAATGDSKPKGD